MNDYVLPEGCALILRTCNADMTSHGGFRWPESGPVECPDWNPEPVCGGGLHGLLWGEGDGVLLNWDNCAKWVVAEVRADEMIDLVGKVKFPRANVVYSGDRKTATDWIARHAPHGTAIAGHVATAGYSGTASAGDYGNASAGYYGTASAGNGGNASAGNGGNASAGYHGTASAGDCGTASAGDYGTASAGYRGTASAGDGGTASAGDFGNASAGYRGTATAGDGGVIAIRYHDGRCRIRVGYIGEDGLLPNVPYRLDEHARFVRADARGGEE